MEQVVAESAAIPGSRCHLLSFWQPVHNMFFFKRDKTVKTEALFPPEQQQICGPVREQEMMANEQAVWYCAAGHRLMTSSLRSLSSPSRFAFLRSHLCASHPPSPPLQPTHPTWGVYRDDTTPHITHPHKPDLKQDPVLTRISKRAWSEDASTHTHTHTCARTTQKTQGAFYLFQKDFKRQKENPPITKSDCRREKLCPGNKKSRVQRKIGQYWCKPSNQLGF